MPTRAPPAARTVSNAARLSESTRRTRQAAVLVRVSRHESDQLQLRVLAQRAREELRDLGEPEVLVFNVDQRTCPVDRLGYRSSDASLSVDCERILRAPDRIGAKHLDGMAANGGRRSQRGLQRTGETIFARSHVTSTLWADWHG